MWCSQIIINHELFSTAASGFLNNQAEELNMKRPLLASKPCLLALLVVVFVWCHTSTVEAQHAFPVKEYEAFHDVLHPLEHEALPQKDYARIRKHATELVRRGQAIVKLGVPKTSKVPDEMKKELRKFRKALKKFSSAARTGNDDQLRITYTAVHDSFEQLAALSRE